MAFFGPMAAPSSWLRERRASLIWIWLQLQTLMVWGWHGQSRLCSCSTSPMNTQSAHEEGIVRAFILPIRRRRYLEFLKSPKTRKKFTGELAHFKHLDTRKVVSIPGRQQHPKEILELLVAKGAGAACWVMSENQDLDAQEMELREALEETIGRQMGTFISCMPGKLAFSNPSTALTAAFCRPDRKGLDPAPAPISIFKFRIR